MMTNIFVINTESLQTLAKCIGKFIYFIYNIYFTIVDFKLSKVSRILGRIFSSSLKY